MIGVFFATGFEEVEALAVVDTLRRASLDTKMISIYETKNVTGSHNIEIIADDVLGNINFDELDAIVLPGGGPGFKNLEKCDLLMEKAGEFSNNKDKLLAAICGAPTILGHKGILKGRTATCYPGMDDELVGAKVTHKPVCVDGNLITSRGVGTALEFGLAIVEYYKDAKFAEDLAKKMVIL